MLIGNSGIYEGVIQAGLALADTPESEGGWKEYFSESDDADLRIPDPYLRSTTALMLENAKRWLGRMCRGRMDEKGRMIIDETTRSALVGGFSDYLFPIIRAGFPTNPINDLVSVQPTTRRTATIVYWNWVVGRGKGSYYEGMRLFDAQKGKQDSGFNFSNEVIDIETLGQLGGAAATIGGTLRFHDGGGVRPSTVAITATTTGSGVIVLADNGNGAFVQAGGTAVTISASSINYKSGSVSITLGGGETFTTAAYTATYRWDSEGSSMLPQVDVQIISSTAETERRAMMLNYSMEAMQDIMAEFGVSLEPNLVSGAAEQMNFEVARQLVHEMWMVSDVASTFPVVGPTEFNQQDHFKDLIYNLNAASNTIWRRTQKAYGNWIVVDEGAANLIESLPAGMFVAAPRPASVQGLHFIGTLVGKYRVYKDIHLDKEPGASVKGNMLMGFKGTQFYEAGLVWSPYQLLYTTDSLTTADFLTQKGMASRYATKMVNKDMYVRVNLS
jgi:hypothetical protein